MFYPPTCVGLRYGRPWKHTKAFLDGAFAGSASAEASTSPCGTATFDRRPDSCSMSLSRLTIAGAGILSLLSIVYAHRPRLRSRLTLGGRTFPRKPWVYGGRGSYPAYRYSCLHPHSRPLHRTLRSDFTAAGTLPYHSTGPETDKIQSFGTSLIANYFRRKTTR